MDDAGVRRYDREVGECRLAPAQERIALAVPLELEQRIQIERIGSAVVVHHDRVVDHELGRDQRVDAGRVAPQLRHRIAHGGQVDDGGHAREVLHDHARGREGDFALRELARIRLGEREDIFAGDRAPVLVAQQVLQQDLQRVGQASDVRLADGL